MNQVLERVKEFADKAHGNQMRKYTPERYIVHPIRVMEICSQVTSSLPVLAAALLHDVLEDTPITKDEMCQELVQIMSKDEAHHTIELVVELTDVYIKSAYPQWNRKKRKQAETERIARNSPEAQTIKYADIIDNSREIGTHDDDFGKVFLKECKRLLHSIDKGHPDLYRKAKDVVNASLQAVYAKDQHG